MKKLLIVDGNSIINRAFYAINLSTKDGFSTGGIYGFLNILTKKIEEEAPDYTVVTFDVKAPTFRHEEYSLYKAQRKGMPPELAQQMPVAKEVLQAMNIGVIEFAGFEADDVIGTVSAICEKEGVLCQILTGDKDSLQLASESTHIHLIVSAMGKTETKVYTPAEVMERYSLTPAQFIDLKGLMGDPSDNIPGVAGIGEKTATNLLLKYGSIEGVYEHIDDGEIKGAQLTKLKNGEDMAHLSKRLATIVRDVPIDFEFENFAVKPYNTNELIALLERLDFKSMIKKMNLTEEQIAIESVVRDKKSGTNEVADKLKNSSRIYYTIEEDGVNLFFEDELYVFKDMLMLADIFENENIQKYGHNVKEDILKLDKAGIKFNGIGFDSAIAAYILNPARSEYTLSETVHEYMGAAAESSAASLPKLCDRLCSEMEENGQHRLYFDIELPLVPIMASMQTEGFKVDKQMLEDLSAKLTENIDKLESKIYYAAEKIFNINSTKQLGEVLFEHLGLPPVKKTKRGYSTDVDVLKKLRTKHPVIDFILDYRQLTKLKSTYTDGLMAVINEKTGKIHSSFNQTVTTTGRISSTEPNLQNIPVKMELGREIRKVFVASDDDHILVDADYSQIELRVLAHISGDTKMTEAFIHDRDIHTQTAAEVFGVAEFMVTPEMRSSAKAVNFGIVYGIGEFSLAEDIGTTRKEAKAYIDSYLETYSAVNEFMQNTVAFARENGYVKTLLNRRRYIPEISASNFNLRSFGERVAMNAPIQGSAADIIKIAMVNVTRELKKRAPRSKLILQVHDELIVEAHKDELELVKEILITEMEKAYPMSVPLKADLGVGKNWYEAK